MRRSTRTGRKTTSLVAVTAGLAAALAVTAPAWASNVGGGTWTHGVSFGINYSDYYHPNNNHKSAVKSGGITASSGCTDPGKTSDAWTWATVSGNQAFWNNSC
jgi:lactococcin 972 family bacteriocin